MDPQLVLSPRNATMKAQCSAFPGVAREDSFLTDTPVGIADATSVQSELRSALSSTLEVYAECG